MKFSHKHEKSSYITNTELPEEYEGLSVIYPGESTTGDGLTLDY